MKKFFWMAVGAGVTVLIVVKGKDIARRFTPQGVAEQATKLGRNLEQRVNDFFATVTENAAAREAELREALDMDTEAQS